MGRYFAVACGQVWQKMHLNMRFASLLRCVLAVFSCLIAASPEQMFAQGTLIGSTTRRDMVFDHAGKYLYISTSTGVVQRYNLSTGRLESPLNLGGSLNGLDISADDTFLLVAQNDTGISQGTFQKVDLNSGIVINLGYTRAFSETGAWDVAIASNNLALVTTQYGGSGWTPLRQIDLTTNTVTTRTDAPGSGGGGMVRQNTQIYRSADRTRLYLLESNISSGPIFTYSATTNTFGPKTQTNAFLENADAGVNRNGTLLGTHLFNTGLSLDTAPDFTFVHSFNGIDHGVAFDAVRDIVYGGNSSIDEIIGYDTGTFAEKFRAKIGEDVPANRQSGVTTLVASQDSRYVAMATTSGIRLLPTVSTGSANLANISTRVAVQTGDFVLIGGFIISGSEAKTVIIRAIGPSLTSAGVANALQDPFLELHGEPNNGVIVSNDNWQSAPNSSDVPQGFRPADMRESVILTTLQPGSYTAIVSGSNKTSGVGLVEVYDLAATASSRLANVSTRGFVQTGDNVMIGGFIAQGGDGISQIVVRAIGPSLTTFGVSNALANPTLELRDGNGAMIRSNDNWKDNQQTALQATGLAPSNDFESAILATVTAGNYTAIVRGVNNSTGVALVEVYDLD